jgi:hypothetical protein
MLYINNTHIQLLCIIKKNMGKRIEENIPILGRVYVNFIELSEKIFDIYLKEGEIERQKNISHLGLIAKAFNGINHSRYEYLILQCVISELAENNFKGTTSAQGSIKINKKEYFGNDIIKSWFLLSNFGHCKNTIGDEKALLLKAIQQKGFKSKLLNAIKDPDLKKWGDLVIDNFDYVKFHHILSIRRIYKSIPRKISLQNELISIYKLLLLESNATTKIANSIQVEQLKLIHNNIRNLSVIALDSRNSSLPITIDILSTVLSFDFYENRYQQTKTSEILNPLLSLLYDTLYLNTKSQTYQRSYETKAFSNITKNFNETIEKSFKTGLSDSNKLTLKHFLRIELHVDFVKEKDLSIALRNFLTVKRGVKNVEVSLDYNPFTSFRVMDFYLIKDKFKSENLPKFITNISNLLDQQVIGTLRNEVAKKNSLIKDIKRGFIETKLASESVDVLNKIITKNLITSSTSQIKSKNIPPFKEILWALLRYHIKDNYYFDIDHHTSSEYNFFGINSQAIGDLLSNEINNALSIVTDVDRKHELNQLKHSTKRKFDGTIISCLSRITIYDYSKPPSKRKVTDIDSLVLKFNENKLFLELHESKNTKNPVKDAKKDLRSHLINVLDKNIKYSIKDVKGFGAKIVIQHNA